MSCIPPCLRLDLKLGNCDRRVQEATGVEWTFEVDFENIHGRVRFSSQSLLPLLLSSFCFLMARHRLDRARKVFCSDLNAYCLPHILQLTEKAKKDYGDRIGAVRCIPSVYLSLVATSR
jgi:hypothetical protein